MPQSPFMPQRILGFSALAGVVLLGLSSVASLRINHFTADRIKKGMKIADAKKLIGLPTGIYGSPNMITGNGSCAEIQKRCKRWLNNGIYLWASTGGLIILYCTGEDESLITVVHYFDVQYRFEEFLSDVLYLFVGD